MPITENNSTSTKVTMRNGTPSKVSQSQTYTKSESSTRRTYGEKYPWSSFLNIPTFAILFVMVIIGSSFLYYNNNIDTYMPTVDANGLRQPYKVEYLNDQPISELNGLTLNEVFDDNNTWISANGMGYYSNNITRSEIPYLEYDFHTIQTFTRTGVNLTSLSLQTVYLYLEYQFDEVPLNMYLISLDYSSTNSNNIFSLTQQNGIYSNIITRTELGYLLLQTTTSIPIGSAITKWYVIDTISLGIDTLTKEQMDEYYNLYQEQDGVQFDNYYYLDVDDYSVLGQKVVDGYNMAFNEDGIFYTALNLVDSVENALYTVYTMIFRSNVLMDQQFDRVSEDLREGLDPSMVYDPPSKIEQVYRALPKWMQPDTWFD
jgi:hypothetical protein